MSRLLSNQSRRISQRRPFFGFESSVSSSLLTDDDPVSTTVLLLPTARSVSPVDCGWYGELFPNQIKEHGITH